MGALYPQTYVAGIDVSKDSLEFGTWPTTTSCSVPNTPQGYEQLVEHLKKFDIQHFGMEATGGYEKGIAKYLHRLGFQVSIVYPRRIRDYARALGILAKTDSLDARAIARFTAEVKPRPTVFLGGSQGKLDGWVARRRQLIQMRNAETNRMEHVEDEVIRESIQQVVAMLDQQIQRLEAVIDQSIQADEQAMKKVRILQQVVGVGPVTCMSLITELPQLGEISRRRIAALVGVAPLNRDSGRWKGKRKVGGGRSSVRSVLYMATLTARRCNPVIKAHFEHLTRQGKCFKVAMVACMRKLLIHLNSLLAQAESMATGNAAT